MRDDDPILFLLGTQISDDDAADYLVQTDPSQTIVGAREPERRTPAFEEMIPTGVTAPSGARARGPHVPGILDGEDLDDELEETPVPGAVGLALPDAHSGAILVPPPEADDRGGPSANRIAVQERILSRVRVRELVRAMARYRSIGILSSAFDASTRARAIRFDRERDEIAWELEGAPPRAPFVAEVAGYNSVYELPFEDATVRDGLLYTPLPSEAVRVRRRWSRRKHAPDGCTVDLHLDDGRTVLRARELRDVSFGGLSFWNDPGHRTVDRNTELDYVLVRVPGREPMRFGGSIRFAARTAPGRDLCGMRLDPLIPADTAAWQEFISSLLYPTTTSSRGMHEALWKIFQESGYFQLSNKRPDEFEPLHANFDVNASALEAHPELGFMCIWPVVEEGARQVFATMTMLKQYSRSWFVCQLAKPRGDAPDGATGRQILRDIHLHCYEHIQQDPTLSWLIGYSQVKQVWTRSVLYDLPRRYTHAGLACVVRFRALHVSSTAALPVTGADIEVGPATEVERALIQKRLKRERPRPYLEALDLTPERIDLAQSGKAWAEAGLPRSREIRVARRGGRAVAAALVELGAHGLHLFRFLDLVRPFPLVDDLAEAVPAMDALVAAAQGFYRGHGRPIFTCFIENDGWLSPAMRGAVEDLGLADMTILSAHVLPELLEHLIEVTAPRTMPVVPAVRRRGA